MATLLVIYPGRDCMHDSVFHLLVAETGEHLASHLCSHAGFAMGDLYAHRKERIEEFGKRFGEVEVKYLDETDISIDVLKARNEAWGKMQESEKQNEDKQVSISVEVE